MSADPPRRPPPHQLFRSKSYQGPPRRKRGREVLEDITWIVNDPSSWGHQAPSAGVAGLEIEAAGEARADGREGNEVQGEGEDEQPAASTSRVPYVSRLQPRLNLAGINNTPHLFSNNFSNLQSAPLPRLTAQDPMSSSPPSSPRFPSSSFGLGVPSGSGTSRSLSPSPSIRAPPLSRRGSSSSLNGGSNEAGASSSLAIGGAAMRRVRTHTGIRTASSSPTIQQEGNSNGSEQTAFEGATFVRRVNTTTVPTLPIIAQSPERKKTRRHDGNEEEDEDEDQP